MRIAPTGCKLDGWMQVGDGSWTCILHLQVVENASKNSDSKDIIKNYFVEKVE